MADNAFQAPEEASAETQEILKELETEGRGTPAGNEPANGSESPEEKAKAEAEAAEKAAAEAKAKGEADAKAKADAENNGDDGTKKNQQPERKEKFVPVQKHNEERHKRQEAEARAEEAERKAKELEDRLKVASDKPNGISDEIKAAATALAEKHGLEPSFVNELLETTTKITSKQSNLPNEVLADLATLKQAKAEAEEARMEQLQDTAFEKEFADVIKEFPDMADRKEDLKELAFSEGNINTSLRRIALEYRHDNSLDKPGRKSAEAPVHSKEKTEVIDFAEMTEDQLKALDGKELDAYLDWLDKPNSKK